MKIVAGGLPSHDERRLSRFRRRRGHAELDSHAPMAALMLLLFGLAPGALLPQLPELLRIAEEAGDAFLAHPDALALALPCQGHS